MIEILVFIVIGCLILVFFIVVYSLILRRSGEEGEITTGGGPVGDLHERFIRGEITVDQYQEMRREIQEQAPENIVKKYSRYF